MKTIGQYREDIKNLMKKSGDIDAKATSENRELTEAELSLKNEILDTVEELYRVVATMERQDRIGAAMSGPANQPASKPGPQGQPPAPDREKFQSFGHLLVSAVNAARPGGRVDPRLFTAAATGLGESVPSDGGLI